RGRVQRVSAGLRSFEEPRLAECRQQKRLREVEIEFVRGRFDSPASLLDFIGSRDRVCNKAALARKQRQHLLLNVGIDGRGGRGGPRRAEATAVPTDAVVAGRQGAALPVPEPRDLEGVAAAATAQKAAEQRGRRRGGATRFQQCLAVLRGFELGLCDD